MGPATKQWKFFGKAEPKAMQISHKRNHYLNMRIKDETGQTMVEYVMLLVLVALATFILAPNVRDSILKVFQNTSSAIG